MASALTGTDWTPKPTASTARAATSTAIGTRTGVGRSSSIPSAATASPSIATPRSPRSRVSAGAAAAPATMPRLTGSSASPARTGSRPRISWTQRVAE